MKITNPTPQYINQSYAANNANTNTAANTSADQGKQTQAPPADSINLSSTTRDLQRIDAASAEETEVSKERAERVDTLKQQVQANQYTVNAEQVAEKMIGGIMDEVV
jgi:negative regulator of flagellin synthesis FlgM